MLSGTLGTSFQPLATGLTALVVQLFLAQRTMNVGACFATTRQGRWLMR